MTMGLRQVMGKATCAMKWMARTPRAIFCGNHAISEADGQRVWLAIALHTTNGISPHLYPIAALLAEGAYMDLVGAGLTTSLQLGETLSRRLIRPP
jgi:hypothetical protein